MAIIFSIERLYRRRNSPNPTGIDRLDVRYAWFFLQLKNQGRDVYFVRQWGNSLDCAEEHKVACLLEALYDRWVMGSDFARSVSSGFGGGKLRVLNWFKVRISPQLSSVLAGGSQPLYVNVSHTGLDNKLLLQQLQDKYSCSFIFYIHDLIPIDYPQYCSSNNAVKRAFSRMEAISSVNAHLLTNSQYSKGKIEKYFLDRGLRVPPVSVSYIGVEEVFIKSRAERKASRTDSSRDYFVVVGTVEPRKNHLTLLKVWTVLLAELGKEKCPQLRILGKRGWACESFFEYLEKNPELNEVVHLHETPTDREIVRELLGAKALLFPSYEEGWGMPAAEALTLGVPVICAKIPALIECCQGHAVAIPPNDIEGWKRAILQFVENIGLCVEQCYKPYRWDNHLKDLNSLIRSITYKQVVDQGENCELS